MCIELPWNILLAMALVWGLLIAFVGIVCWMAGYSNGCSNRTRLEFNRDLREQLSLMAVRK